ncbi:UNVERIFIED_CONTAM: hypothetical protein PYX00_003987 [Menopon gallinae]|uniref:Dehydrogenase/reductase SDR family member 7 n=1 Tax=Menopon gallinae TaxID=328185 RepID=A0AAW2I4K3_9NEOP
MGFFTYIGMSIIIYYMIYLVLFFLVDCDIALALAEKFGRNLSKLRGKVIWITEASNSVGEAIAYEIARNNGKMVLSSIRCDELHFIKQKCLELNPYLKSEDILILTMDITKIETHKSCFNSVIHHFGSIDIMISISGKGQRAMWEDINLDLDRDMFKLNVFGIVSLSRTAVQYFGKKGNGHIVVLSSLAGIIGVPYSSSYTASLHAIHGYFESLRNEKLGTNLQITLIYPGPIACNISREQVSCSGNECFQKIQGSEHKGMTAKRCAHLALLAVVNNLDEAWMASRPFIPLIYTLTHFPNLARKIAQIVNPRRMEWLMR